jgi:CubicO group peptidase (beta-lactamase class C family)
MKKHGWSRALVFSVVAVLSWSAADGADPREAEMLGELPHFVDQVRTGWKVPGAAVAVVSGDRPIFVGGFGFRDSEGRLPVSGQTVFAAGSTTKAFTALTAVLLADEGLLDLDAPVRGYLPDFRLADDDATRMATTRDLLCHRTGVPRHDAVWYRTDATSREVLAGLRYLEPTAGLRERFQYSNLMYMVAGMVVSEVAASTWEEAVSSRVVSPLGMRRSAFKTAADGARDIAYPHRAGGDGEPERIPFYDGWSAAAAGSLYTTAEDLSRWLLFLVGKGTIDGRPVVSPELVESTYTPCSAVARLGPPEMPLNDYGLGWFVTTYRGSLMVWHEGTIDGFSALVSFLPNERIGVAVLTNRSLNSVPEVVSRWVFDRMLKMPEINWSERLADRDRAAAAERAELRRIREESRRKNTEPSRPLADYPGRYVNPAYGNLTIGLAGDTLSGNFHGLPGVVTHFHDDVFMFTPAIGELQEEFVLGFKVDPEGTVGSVASPLQPGVEPIVFVRVSEP